MGATFMLRARKLWIFLLTLVLLGVSAGPLVSGARTASAAAAQASEPAAAVEEAPEAPGAAFSEGLNDAVGQVNGWMASVLFFSVTGDLITVGKVDAAGHPVLDPSTGQQVREPVAVPFLVAVLGLGALFFTFFYRFMNVRGFAHAIQIVRGKYDDPNAVGEITHFRALTSALSATVGLGNIAGVAIAIQLGGPGAVFWMVVAAFFGMSAKFSSCTLSQLYRRRNADGSISGGPMYYLDMAFAERGGGWRHIRKLLGVMYALMVMAGSFGGGNMFQSNQSFEALSSTFGIPQSSAWIFGVVMAVLVALVILGGIQRIGAATSRIVPAMVFIYVTASLFIIGTNLGRVPESLGLIFRMAFSDNAYYGGAVGVLVWGVKRASFSNEAGIGSSAIAHAAARTDEPVREGLVAMMEPFVDTIIVCLMTATVVIITGAWNDPTIPREAGVTLTTEAFRSVLPWFPFVLTVCILLFAYSTMISWAYYGERGWIYLMDHFGGRGLSTIMVYRVVFVVFVFVGAVINLGEVLTFSDLCILSMAFPNILGSVILAPRVRKRVDAYWRRYKSEPA